MKLSRLLFLTTLMVPQVLCKESYFDALYENMVHAQKAFKEVASAVNGGLKTVAKTVKLVESFIDSTLEEDCIYRCPKNKIPISNPNHTPEANGCGSLGVFFEEKDLPRPEMVQCCNEHDICYDTCGSDKEECDRSFKRCLYRICDAVKKEVDVLGHKKCQGGAKLLYTATLALGCTSYKDAQRGACICVPTSGTKTEL